MFRHHYPENGTEMRNQPSRCLPVMYIWARTVQFKISRFQRRVQLIVSIGVLTMYRTFLAIALAFSSTLSLACSCVHPPEDINAAVSEAYYQADSVVFAEATAIKPEWMLMSAGCTDIFMVPGEVTEFAVLKSWKGSNTSPIHTRIITETSACGRSFEKGKRYLLYLSGPDDQGYYETNWCSRTTEALNGSKDINVLNRGASVILLKPAFVFDGEDVAASACQTLNAVNYFYDPLQALLRVPNFKKLAPLTRPLEPALPDVPCAPPKS
jgi:hypothetical protein